MRFTTAIVRSGRSPAVACSSSTAALAVDLLIWPVLLLVIAGSCVDVASARLLLSQRTPDQSQLLLESGINIPAAVAVPSGNTLHLALRALGHQHYAFNGTAWLPYNATAKLYVAGTNDSLVVGSHYFLAQPDASGGQPSWQTFDELGTVVSRVTAKTLTPVTVDQDSITWNLLQATSYSGSKNVLGDVSYVQRLDTLHGLPPSSTAGAAVGDTYASEYSALYAYYVPNYA